jgi:hypothetical protein
MSNQNPKVSSDAKVLLEVFAWVTDVHVERIERQFEKIVEMYARMNDQDPEKAVESFKMGFVLHDSVMLVKRALNHHDRRLE